MMQSSCSDNCICNFDMNILNLFHPELPLINTKPIIKNKLKELLNELFSHVQSILLLEYKKYDHKTFHSSAELVARNSDINETFKDMHQSIMTKIINFGSKDGVAEIIVKHSMKIVEC